jgi:phospholipid transport system substrate-binding protein
MKTMALAPAPESCASIGRFFTAVLVAWAMSLSVAAGSAPDGPDELVKATSDEVVALIKHSTDRQKLMQLAQEKVVPHFAFDHMTQLAVGKSWQQATPEQRQALTREFRDLLVRTYVNALSMGTDVSVKYLPFKSGGGNEAVVKTQAKQPGRSPVAIDYRMEKAGDEWKVYDVTADGVSLVTNYRDMFATTISESGIDGLVKSLTDKNKSASK